MIDTSKILYNSFGVIDTSREIMGATRVIVCSLGNGSKIEYVVRNGKAPVELGEKFDIFNKLTQKEKAIAEVAKYNDETIANQRITGGCLKDDAFESRFPEISKLIEQKLT